MAVEIVCTKCGYSRRLIGANVMRTCPRCEKQEQIESAKNREAEEMILGTSDQQRSKS